MLAALAQKEAAQDELGHRLSCNGKNVNLFADLFEFRFRVYKYFWLHFIRAVPGHEIKTYHDLHFICIGK